MYTLLFELIDFFQLNMSSECFLFTICQTPDVFKTRSLFIKPVGYSEHCQTSTMERFCKNSSKIKSLYFLIFREMKLSSCNIKKLFQETKLSYTSLIFQEVTFRDRKIKKTLWKNFLYLFSQKRLFLYFRNRTLLYLQSY